MQAFARSCRPLEAACHHPRRAHTHARLMARFAAPPGHQRAAQSVGQWHSVSSYQCHCYGDSSNCLYSRRHRMRNYGLDALPQCTICHTFRLRQNTSIRSANYTPPHNQDHLYCMDALVSNGVRLEGSKTSAMQVIVPACSRYQTTCQSVLT